ncbi:TadE/TadG family type IV pilus assembly protein [Sphingomonas sp.]|uniref:TadE/TadG family type IV pilus assembly protein n=1 Tax=Sphingomonas sp. TaxID=28214 RepID=UPI0025CBF3D4|nr:TadE/TadG family type IV pilus assembly protein [Sphingomonas sp.]MBV9527189.1 pilus assembly protein [Sphingomonas sp.]
MSKLSIRNSNLLVESSGLATIEFAIASSVLMLGLLNGLETARYSFQKMEVANAVHAAAHAAWNACDTKHLPALSKCTTVNTAINNGIQSTSLGSAVTLSTTTVSGKTVSYPFEGYYCLTTAGALKKEADYTGTKPTDCSAEGDSAHTPGDYLVIKAQATYAPLFSSKLTIGSLFGTTLSATSTIRLQ